MAYSHPGLHPVGPSNSDVPRLWSYSTTDTQADVNTAGYFNDASTELNVGDRIMANCDTDGTPAYVDFIVASNASGVVDVTDGVVPSATDTD